MTANMSKDRMGYELLIREAQRYLVKLAMKRVVKEGLPGNHHFFISFRTDAEDVEISDALRAQYPEEMTIVLQNQFWDLAVDEEGFSVSLKFNQVMQPLRIPFHALTMFSDPAVQLQLQLQPVATAGTPTPVTPSRFNADAAALPKPEPEPARPARKLDEKGAVVSLDAFRKK
ncbi:MAG: ClpXP protease specificity-enhancing factor SspB [Alphaproteobacteria bacterium]